MISSIRFPFFPDPFKSHFFTKQVSLPFLFFPRLLKEIYLRRKKMFLLFEVLFCSKFLGQRHFLMKRKLAFLSLRACIFENNYFSFLKDSAQIWIDGQILFLKYNELLLLSFIWYYQFSKNVEINFHREKVYFSYNYHLVTIIKYCLAQSDHIMRLLLYL